MNNVVALPKVERIRGRRWLQIRSRVMNRDGWLCVPCKAHGRITPARQVDHITPIEAGGDNALDNLQAICLGCHESKTNSESSGAAVADIPWYLKRIDARPLITIVGPAYSGKQDKALELARPGDKIVNADSIAILSFGRRYFSALTRQQKREVLRTRNRALKDYLDGDHFTRCICCVQAPSFKERQFWRSISHEFITMNYDPDECKRKAERDLVGSDDLVGIVKDIDSWQ